MPLGEQNLFGLTQYDYKTSFFGGNAVLSQVRYRRTGQRDTNMEIWS